MNDQGNTQEEPFSDSQIPAKTQEKSFKKEVILFIWETLKIIIVCLAIIIPIRYYIVQPFFVKGASMESSFEDGDYLLVDEITYRFSDPKRGDVIVFRYPEDESQFFIKRIIALPGEIVEIKNNTVSVSSKDGDDPVLLEESYLDRGQTTLGSFKLTLGQDEFYVLGDNRLHSADSRRWGPVKRDEIIGRTLLRAWPINKFSKIKSIEYK